MKNLVKKLNLNTPNKIIEFDILYNTFLTLILIVFFGICTYLVINKVDKVEKNVYETYLEKVAYDTYIQNN
jgi:Na+/phosphate symporter